MQLAKESDLRALIHAMFRGGKISITENGAVLQVALSAPKGASIVVDGENVVPRVHAALDKMVRHSPPQLAAKEVLHYAETHSTSAR